MLEHKNIVIFSPPRSGTKLLAKILENFGYFSHGEWFAPRSTKIENNKSIRINMHLEEITSLSERQFKNLKDHIYRHELYKKLDKNVITIWPEQLSEYPFMLYDFVDYHWVCVRRNSWEQILSYYISSKNSNFDGVKTSQPVTFKEPAFRKMYWNYHTICSLQDWLVENRSATLIDFEELIQGISLVFGQSYEIKSKDEHTNLESLVENLDHVNSWYDKYEQQRLKQ